MRRRLALLFVFAIAHFHPSFIRIAAAQAVSWFTFDPLVVPSTFTQPVRLEAAVNGPPTRVTLDLNAGGTVELRDDGAGGDRQAGDGVFTASLDAAALVRSLRADDVHREFVGFLNVFLGATVVLRGNLFVDVLTPDVPMADVRLLGPGVQATSHVVNIVDPAYLADSNVQRVAQAFYRWYSDSYDFLNVISVPARFQNRGHVIVRNDVTGIGLNRSDNSAAYGSAGRLRGYTVFPIADFYDGAENGYSHETGHQWINHLGFAPFAPGVPHWPISSMATGTMGFSIGGGGGEGGDFSCNVADDGTTVRLLPVPPGTQAVFNDFDLYLMGLLPPESVGPQVVLTGATSAPPCNGQTYTGQLARVDVNAIVTGAGRRVPDAANAPKEFRAATILVSRDGLVSPETMALYSWLTERAERTESTPIHSGFVKATGNPFYVQTRGLGLINTLLSSDPDFSLKPAQAAVTVSRGQNATFTISALPTSAGFGQAITFSCGPLVAPLTCAFSPSQVTPGNTGADVTLSVTTGAATSTSTALAALAVLVGFACVARERRRLVWAAVGGMVLLAAGCGSSPSAPATPSTPAAPGPTPAATVYTIAVTGSAGALSHSVNLTLTVQ